MHVLTALDIALRELGESDAADNLLDHSQEVIDHGASDETGLKVFFALLPDLRVSVDEVEFRVITNFSLASPAATEGGVGSRNLSFALAFFARARAALVEYRDASSSPTGSGSKKRALEVDDDSKHYGVDDSRSAAAYSNKRTRLGTWDVASFAGFTDAPPGAVSSDTYQTW